MNKLVILFVIVACLSIGIDGRVYQVIDTFSQFQAALQLAPSPYGESPADYDWFSPYNTNGVNPPAVFIKNTNEALGGQRDSILGFKTTSSSGITARFSLLPAAGTALVAFPIGYVGASYVQWDGNDQTAGQGPTVPFPAAILSRNPGIGSNATSANADGRSYDFTFAGAAKGLTIQITSDLDVVYTLTALDTNVGINIINLPIVGAENVTRNYYIRYDDRRWTQPAFNWAQTTAFQVKVNTNGGVSGAIDTSYRLLNIYTFEIGGTVFVDCGCDGTPEGGVANLTMDLFNTTGGINILVDNTLTNATGSYRFFNFNFPNGEIVTAQTYRICIRDTSTSLCNNQNRCTDVTLSNPIIDILTFDYFVIPPATLAPPPDVSLECGQSTATSNTGVAQLTSCNGTTPVTTNSDQLNQQACVTTITRTFTDTGSGRTVTQRITVTDTQPPVFTVQPSNPVVSCGGSPTLAQYVQTNGGAQATDVCNFQGITNNFTTGGVGNCGAITLQFTARDTCGLTATTIGTYTSNDANPPTFDQQPTPLNIECDFKTTANNPNTRISNYLANRGGAVVTDDCTSTGAIGFTNDFVATTLTSSTACAYTQTVTFTARDQCNNAAVATSLISVSDTQNPQITVPASDVTSQCSTSGTGANPQFQSFLTNRGGAQATDLCAANDGSLNWSNDYTGNGQVGSTCGDQITVTFTVTDACGRTNSTTARYLVVDNTPPTITTRASNASPQCDGNGNTADYQNFISSRGGFVASDNCGDVVYSNDAPPTGPTGCGQSVTVTFTATQQCTPVLSVVSTATYTVLDSTPPTFVTSPQSQSIECGGNPNTQYQAWLANNAGATVTDACSPQGLTIQNNAGTQTITSGCNNAITVTFTARDGCNNVSPGQTATFRVQDTIAPVFTTQPTSVSVTCNSTTNSQDYTNFLNNNAGAVATDSCSNTITYSNDSPGPVSATCNFVRTVTFTARDGCGLTATTSATFSITDTTPPTITTPAAPVSVECTGDNSADLQSFLNTRGGAQAVDNCGGVTWSNDFTALPSGCIRSVPVTFTARDVCGLTATTTATYTVSDNSSPVISVPANDVFVECDRNSDGSRFQNFLDTRGGAQATDVCSPQELLVWSNTPAQSPESCSTAQVTFTVTDPCGRTASTTALFTVRDRIAPVFTTAPQPVQVECNGSGNTADYQNFIATRAGAVATDACALNVAYTTNAPATGPVGCGFVTAQFTAADECGNAATVTTTFRVVDTSAPVFITAPQNRTVECNPSSTDSDVVAFLTSRGNAVASDSCYTSDSLIWSNNYRVLTSEACRRYATVTFTVRDPCGASNTATATFESVDRTAPQILVGATSLTLECNATNAASIQTYLAQNGGASATDSCTTVSFTNDFTVAPEECTSGVPVVFTARDVCGNSVTTTGLITIVDSTPPSFRTFPNNVRLGCDRDISPANAGTPTGFDLCDTNTTLSFSDIQFKQPDELFCPGDLVTIRTWVVIDDCGNVASKNQTITTVFSGTSRPCLPSECPLCELDVCCPVVTERVLCNPVPCNSVPCRAVGCTSVPCIPNSNCGSVPSPDPEGPGPQPSVLPSPSCEPVYIYIFDDDGPDMPDDVTGASGNNGGVSNASAAGSLVASLLFTVFLLFALI